MEYTKLTSNQQKIVNYLGLFDSEIEMIVAFDRNGWPLDGDGNAIPGDFGYELKLKDHYMIEEAYYEIDEDKIDNRDVFDIDLYKLVDEEEVKEPTFRNVKQEKTYNDDWKGGYDWKGYKAEPYVKLPECHTGTIKVFECDGVNVHGGGSTRGGTYWGGMVILDLADRIDQSVTFINVDMPEVEKECKVGIVKIDWRDFGVPDLSRAFWESMVVALKRICQERGGYLDVFVCCMGGHGRTGTALSILAALFGVVPDDMCPVQYVRDHYCNNAVETDSQLKYVESMTGRKVKAETSKAKSIYLPKKEEKK